MKVLPISITRPSILQNPGTMIISIKEILTNWIKAANTIKLKLYTQVRLVQDVKAQVTALLAAPT